MNSSPSHLISSAEAEAVAHAQAGDVRRKKTLTFVIAIFASLLIFHCTPIALAQLSSKIFQFHLQASVQFDGNVYDLTGFEKCTYEQSRGGVRSDPTRLGGPIVDGQRISTSRDSPSGIVANGAGAIIIEHSGSCPSLKLLQQGYLADPSSAYKGVTRAYYLPDRYNPPVVWVLADRRLSHGDNIGRYVSLKYDAIATSNSLTPTLATNAPAAWGWYEEFSAKYRTAMSGGGRSHESHEAIWRGIFGCIVYESEWRNESQFARIASNTSTMSFVALNAPGRNLARPCIGTRTPRISLAPSSDYSKATLDVDRADLRWATITTPFVAQLRDRDSGRWTPEICIAGEACTGHRMRAAVWLYIPNRRVFVRLDEDWFEMSRFSNFALRQGDGL